jgi:menaquinone-dependent protoporphyrinogen oxidase
MQRMPSAFFSVSLSEADPNPKPHARLTTQVTHFLEETSWHPDKIASFAGSIAYLRYHWIMRLIWPRLPLPGRSGAGRGRDLADSDYEYTDWDAVARFADEFATEARSAPHKPFRVDSYPGQAVSGR